MKALFTILAVFFALNADAQEDTILIVHNNGRPALTGQCSYDYHRWVAADLRHGVRAGRIKINADGDAVEDLADADEGVYRWSETLNLLIALRAGCEGPVRAYYRDGKLRMATVFRAGMPSGTYAEYYPSGSVRQRCTLTNGMLNGTWTQLYKNGRPYGSGRFLPFSGGLLSDWEARVHDGSSIRWTGFVDTTSMQPGYTREGLRSSYSDEAAAVRPWTKMFEPYLGGFPNNGLPHGPILFKNRSGQTLAVMQFDSGVCAGIWTVNGVNGKLKARLEYEKGELTHVTDSTGKRATVAAYTEGWRRQQANDRTRHGVAVHSEPSGIDPDIFPIAPGLGLDKAAAPPPGGIYTVVDQPPKFPGDVAKYISNNVRYPETAKQEGVEGRVVVRIVVDENGKISDPTIIRGIGHGCDEEALRVVREMPKWTPATIDGKAVKAYFHLPVKFVLN